MASATVDELITRYTLQDHYSAKAAKIERATAGVGRAMKGAKPPIVGFKNILGDTGDAGGGLADVLGSLSGVASGPIGTAFTLVTQVFTKVFDVIKQVATAAIGLGVAFAGLSYWAVQQYAKFQSIKLTFAGIADSMEKAEQMMAAIKSYSFKSVFDEEPLAKAALQLTQLNLAAGEYLPVIEAIALRSGEITPEGLLEVVSILRRLRGGQVADALGPEGIGRFGISKADLTALGAVFDESGQFKGNVQDALNLLKQLANSPETLRIRKMLEDSPETKISNALGQMQAAFRAFGATMSQYVIPALETVGKVFGWIAESGLIDKIAYGFASLFGEQDGQRALVKVLLYVVTVLEYLPELLKSFGMVVKTVFDTIVQSITGPIQLLLYAVDKLTGTHLQDGFNNMIKKVLLNSNPIGALVDAMGDAHNIINALADQKMKSFDKWQADKASQGDTPFPDLTKPEKDKPVEDALNSIKDNTAKTAENTKPDMRRYILGGGDLGRMGVTRGELAGSGGRSGEVKVRIENRDLLTDMLEGLMQKVLREAKRQGAI